MYNSPRFHHGITNGAQWYSVDGGMQDWNYRYLSNNDVTIELSDRKWPAEATVPGFWADNRESMISYAEAVHIGARVASKAQPREIFVSSTLMEAVAGSDIRFEDRGSHKLKGIPGEWNLFAVKN